MEMVLKIMNDFASFFIINLIRNNIHLITENECYINNEYCSDDVIKKIIEHKILLHYCSDIIKNNLLPNQNNKLRVIFFNEKTKRRKYIDFLEVLVGLLNENNISFVVYKGYILESLIYTDIKRTYSDIDIILDDFSEFEKVRRILYNNFDVNLDTSLTDTIFIGEYKIEIVLNNIIYCIEFKTPAHYVLRSYENLVEVKVKNEICKTFSLEITFANLILYLYQYIENMYYLQYGNRHTLQYIVDLYEFIIKYQSVLNWKKFYKIICENNMKDSLNLIIHVISEIYNTDIVKDIFRKNNVLIMESYKSNFDCPIVSRFIFKQEVLEFYRNHLKGKFFLDNNFNIYHKMLGLNPFFKIGETDVKIFPKEKSISIDIDKLNFNMNYIIQVQLFYYDIYGQFIAPYRSIVVRCENGIVYLSGTYFPRGVNHYDKEMEKNAIKYKENEVKTIQYDDKITIRINYNALEIDNKKRIGINLVLYELNDFKLVPLFLLVPFWNNPLIIK